MTAPKVCAVGRFQDSDKASSPCTACAPGRYTGALSSAECKLCPSGKMSHPPLASDCTNCPAGKFQHFTSSSTCRDCPIGKHQHAAGSSRCNFTVAPDVQRALVRNQRQAATNATGACKPPTDLHHGRLLGLSHSGEIGSVARFRCDPGYQLEGSASLVCTAVPGGNPGWIGVVPKCSSTGKAAVRFKLLYQKQGEQGGW